MADISPFRGIRYRDDIALDDVVAPPYDVLSAAQAAELQGAQPLQRRARRPARAARRGGRRGGLPPRPPPPSGVWRDEGVLVRDELPGIVVVDQTYTRARRPGAHPPRLRRAAAPGRPRRARGPAARAHARRPQGRPPAPVPGDPRRRQPDLPAVPRRRRRRRREAATPPRQDFPRPPGARRSDGDGNRHVAAALAGPAAEAVAEALRGRPVYIADGHHRYETALAYRDERRAAGDPSADTLMVYLCSLGDPGLTVFPTHRLVRGIPPLSLDCPGGAPAPVLRGGRRAGDGRRRLPGGARGAAGAGRPRKGLRPVPAARGDVRHGQDARAGRDRSGSRPAASLPPPPASP